MIWKKDGSIFRCLSIRIYNRPFQSRIRGRWEGKSSSPHTHTLKHIRARVQTGPGDPHCVLYNGYWSSFLGYSGWGLAKTNPYLAPSFRLWLESRTLIPPLYRHIMLVGRTLPYPEEANSMGKVYILEARFIVTSVFRAFYTEYIPWYLSTMRWALKLNRLTVARHLAN